MCDYCGCQRNDAIAQLSDEHEAIMEVAYHLRRCAVEGHHTRAVVLVDELLAMLAPHTTKEEAGLFRQLRTYWEADDRLDVLVDEHRHLEADLNAVRAGEPGWDQRTLAAVHDLSEHVLSEETDLFPYSLYTLSDQQWSAIDELHTRGSDAAA